MQQFRRLSKQSFAFLSNKNTELIVFLLLALANGFYLVMYKYIPSLDGPQHLYNSNVIVELVKGNDFFKQFFQINNVLVGYWNAHAVLSLYNFIFPSWLAEKLFLLTTLTLIPFSFRYLIKIINPNAGYLPILILPFVTNSYFFMGYYAFCFAWIFFFFTIGYFIKNYSEFSKIRKLIILCFLLFLTFLSHMIIFSFTLSVIALYLIYRFICDIIKKETKTKYALLSHVKLATRILISAIPSIIFAIIYSLHVFELNKDLNTSSFASSDLLSQFVNISSLVAFNHKSEGIMNSQLFIFVMALGLISLIFIFINSKKKSLLSKNHVYNIIFWGLLSLLVLILFFVFPNSFGTGSVSKRILVFFYFVFVAWIAMNRLPAIVHLIIIIAVIWYGYNQTVVRHPYYDKIDHLISELVEAEDTMRVNTTFTAINCIPLWNNWHYPCYIGSEKPIVYLKSPQNMGHFPVVWNWEKMPTNYLGLYKSGEAGTSWFNGSINKTIRPIDYVVVYGNWVFNNKAEYKKLKTIIETFYNLVLVSERGTVALYEFKLYDYLEAKIPEIESNEKWMAQIKTKAEIRKLSVENMLLLDAMYYYTRTH